MRQINLHDLRQTTDTIKVKRAMIFDRVLEMCHGKIKRSASAHRSECIYTIPEYVVGLPLYNRNDCMEYVADALRTNGFRIEQRGAVTIRVSWGDEGPSVPDPAKKFTTNTDAYDSVSDMLLLGYDKDQSKRKFVLNVD